MQCHCLPDERRNSVSTFCVIARDGVQLVSVFFYKLTLLTALLSMKVVNSRNNNYKNALVIEIISTFLILLTESHDKPQILELSLRGPPAANEILAAVS